MKFIWENPTNRGPEEELIIDADCYDTDSALRPCYMSAQEISDMMFWDSYANYLAEILGGA